VKLRVDDIKEQGLELEYSEPPESFPALEDLQQRGEVRFRETVSVTGRVRRMADLIEVEGTVQAQATMPCSRCLEPVAIPLTSRFAVTFSKDTPVVADEDTDQEVELSAEEMGLIPFSGDEIDLRDAIQEQVIMSLPLQPLCRSDCRGLCPHCGVDLNRETCQCRPQVFNNRFAKLEKLKIDGNGDG
jgi:DUF177 domain-containing protein